MWLNNLNITGKSKLFPQEPTYIYIQATCYRVTEFKQANKVFFQAIPLLASCLLLLQRKEQWLSFISKGNLIKKNLKESQI